MKPQLTFDMAKYPVVFGKSLPFTFSSKQFTIRIRHNTNRNKETRGTKDKTNE
jgi:hypothetical protein